jgi:hypothetical protein
MSTLSDYLDGTFGKKSKYAAEIEELQKLLASGGAAAKPALPDTPEYERMKADDTSDEQLSARAGEELSGYYNGSLTAIDGERDAAARKYEDDKKSAAAAYETAAAEAKSAYERARENASNDSLKRGLARSSIAVNKQYALGESEAAEISRIAKETAEKTADLDARISELDVKREKALNDFNIAYAAKLTTLINGLKDERAQSNAEALKYNNSLAEKEYSQKVDKTVKESDLYSDSLTQAQKEKDSAVKQNETAVYEKMRGILSGLSRSDAKKALTGDAIFKDNLSEYYYYMLYNEFGR